MDYKFCIHERASRALAKESPEVSERIRSKIEEIATNKWRDITDYDVRVIEGCNYDVYGLRIGPHRVAFLVEGEVIALLAVRSKNTGAYRNTDALDGRAEEFLE